jgi:hypothetical protein
MQLYLRLPAVRHQPDQRFPKYRRMPMQRCLVHLVERPIHHSREIAFNEHAAPNQEAHQAADG